MNYKKVVNTLGLILLIALVVPFVIYAVPGVIGAEYSFVVLTGSMAPAIDAGDVVIVGERDPATIQEGDVITFARGDAETPVTHRVIGVEESATGVAFETKGDANAEADASPVTASAVLGVVVLTIPYIGYIVQATNSPVGFALLVVVPLALFVASELWTLFRANQATVKEDSKPAVETIPVGGPDPTIEPSGETTAVSEPEQITLSASDLVLSTGLLALVTPYTIYVALELQTSLSISVAFAATFSLLTVGGLWFSARYTGGRPSGGVETRVAEATSGSDDFMPSDADSVVTESTNRPHDRRLGGKPATESTEPATDGGRSEGEHE